MSESGYFFLRASIHIARPDDCSSSDSWQMTTSYGLLNVLHFLRWRGIFVSVDPSTTTLEMRSGLLARSLIAFLFSGHLFSKLGQRSDRGGEDQK